jgi:hypothetical protein
MEQVEAKALRGYRFFPHPESPTLGVLRLDTEAGQTWLLVTKKVLMELSQALAEEASKLEGIQ